MGTCAHSSADRRAARIARSASVVGRARGSSGQASGWIAKAAGIPKGAGNPLKDKVGKITKKQLREIAEKKMPDLNANDIEAAMKIIAGSARSMGVEVK